jgi:hypothetical protein
MTIEELKKVTQCGTCHKTGQWHRECPDRDKVKGNNQKETHIIETEERRSEWQSLSRACDWLEFWNDP